jgi:hypothetical protein
MAQKISRWHLTSVRASRFAACQQSRLSSDFGGNVEGVAAGQAAGAGSRLFMAFHSDSLKKFGARNAASGRRSDRLRIVHPSMYYRSFFAQLSGI